MAVSWSIRRDRGNRILHEPLGRGMSGEPGRELFCGICERGMQGSWKQRPDLLLVTLGLYAGGTRGAARRSPGRELDGGRAHIGTSGCPRV